MTSEELKAKLKKIKENDYQIPGDTDLGAIIGEMFSFIGDPDSELRDNLIYSIFANWIIGDPGIPADYLKGILSAALDEHHLFFAVGSSGDDSVLTRSFSVLLIPPLLIRHRKEEYLTKEEVLHIYRKVTSYYSREKDLRGFIEGKGWAHSAAHGADALDDLALCEEIGYGELKHMLELIQEKVCADHYAYINNEDERIVTALMTILSRKIIPDSEVSQWIQSFSDRKNTEDSSGGNYRNLNIKNFLRSLFFRMRGSGEPGIPAPAINSALETYAYPRQ